MSSTRGGFTVSVALMAFVVAAGCAIDEKATTPLAGTSPALAERHPSLDTLDFRAVGLAWLNDATVAVLDRDDQQIVALGLTDGSQRRVAGRGGGPGELESAFMLLGGEDGSLLVGDMRLRRVSEFDAGLAYLRAARIPGLPIALLARRGDRVTAIWIDFRMNDEGGVTFQPIVGEVDLARGEAREFFSLFEPGSGRLAPPETDNPFAPPFIAATMSEDGLILVGQSMEYRVIALDSTGVVRKSFERPELEQPYLTEEEQAAERRRMGERAARGEQTPPGMRRMMDEALEAPRPYFGPGALSLDSAGRLWVITERSRADSTEVDVFDSDGVYLKTLVLRDRVQVLAFRESRIAALVTRRAPELEGIPGIDLYRVVGQD
ncbi:MAG: hypothetical protein JSW46_19265 [Gemmatimonadota bacterium]|nr:MAG: hypothetical protein JSW46_19265 [Gemmatimonadota bacterium]